MKFIFHVLLIVLLSIGSMDTAEAQERPNPNVPQGTNMEVPDGWEVRLDNASEEVIIGHKPDSADIYFVNMTPGWHITTGPAAIFYHPANSVSGSFAIQTEVHFFDPGDRNREAYGLFWGGKNLQDENQAYYYFLIRNTGEYLIKKRTGSETEIIQNWSSAASVNVYDDEVESSSVRNVMAVAVEDEQILFSINGNEVVSLPSDGMENDGIFGLRVNHSINLHISNLAVVSE